MLHNFLYGVIYYVFWSCIGVSECLCYYPDMTSKIGELDEIGFIWFSFPLFSFVLISCFIQHFLMLFHNYFLLLFLLHSHRLCGLVVGVPGYRSKGPGFDSRQYQIIRGPLSLVSTIEELLERKSIGSSLETREYSSRDPLC
jgi:hypothetical protein